MASTGSDGSTTQHRTVAGVANRPVRLQAGRIAIVSPHRRFAGRVAGYLDDSTLDVWTVVFSRTLLDDLAALSPDVVILEHGSTAGIDLARVCRDLSQTLDTRIMVVASEHDAHPIPFSGIGDNDDGETVRASDIDDQSAQIDALDAGADDYVSATMGAGVFLARLRAALRGGAADVTRPIRLDVGDVALDLEAHALYLDGAVTKCPPLQFTLLVALARVPNRVVDRATLASIAWGPLPEATLARRLRVAISVLRSVLGKGPGRPRIESVSNVGYRLVMT